MKLRVVVLSSLVLLAGCSAHPEPDPTLVSLADKAAPAQASALASEATRLCGTRDGAPLCTVTPAASGTLTSAEVLAATEVPASSLPVVAKTYVSLAMHEPERPFGSSSAFESMKEFEQGALFGLDHHLAFAGADTPAVTKSQAAHEKVRYALGSDSAAAPVSYDLGQYPDSPIEFALAVEEDATLRWMNAACDASLAASDREFALIQAGNAAGRYLALGGNAAALGL